MPAVGKVFFQKAVIMSNKIEYVFISWETRFMRTYSSYEEVLHMAQNAKDEEDWSIFSICDDQRIRQDITEQTRILIARRYSNRSM